MENKRLETLVKGKIVPFVICLGISTTAYVDHNYKVQIKKAKIDDYVHSTLFGYYIDIHKRSDFEKEYRAILEER
jgi:hypothetical protein